MCRNGSFFLQPCATQAIEAASSIICHSASAMFVVLQNQELPKSAVIYLPPPPECHAMYFSLPKLQRNLCSEDGLPWNTSDPMKRKNISPNHGMRKPTVDRKLFGAWHTPRSLVASSPSLLLRHHCENGTM